MAVLEPFRSWLDESQDQAAIAMAGYVGSVRAWDRFEPHWQAALDEHGIPYFHMKEIPDPKSPMHKFFGKENEPKLAALLRDLAEVITKAWVWNEWCGVGCLVPSDAINRFNRERGRDIQPIPLAIYTCVALMQAEFPGKTVDVRLDRMTKAASKIAVAMEYLETNPRGFSDLVSIAPANEAINSRTVRPLQAADFSAYEGRKKHKRLDPFFKSVDLSSCQSNMELWYEYEDWLERNNIQSPDERKSLTVLAGASRLRYPIWIYEVLCSEDDLRGGRWRS